MIGCRDGDKNRQTDHFQIAAVCFFYSGRGERMIIGLDGGGTHIEVVLRYSVENFFKIAVTIFIASVSAL